MEYFGAQGSPSADVHVAVYVRDRCVFVQGWVCPLVSSLGVLACLDKLCWVGGVVGAKLAKTDRRRVRNDKLGKVGRQAVFTSLILTTKALNSPKICCHGCAKSSIAIMKYPSLTLFTTSFQPFLKHAQQFLVICEHFVQKKISCKQFYKLFTSG